MSEFRPDLTVEWLIHQEIAGMDFVGGVARAGTAVAHLQLVPGELEAGLYPTLPCCGSTAASSLAQELLTCRACATPYPVRRAYTFSFSSRRRKDRRLEEWLQWGGLSPLESALALDELTGKLCSYPARDELLSFSDTLEADRLIGERLQELLSEARGLADSRSTVAAG